MIASASPRRTVGHRRMIRAVASIVAVVMVVPIAGCARRTDAAQPAATVTSALPAHRVSEAMRLLDNTLRTPCPGVTEGLCAEHTALVIMRTRIVLRDLHTNLASTDFAEGRRLAEAVTAAEGTDLSSAAAQSAVLQDAGRFQRWLEKTVSGYPPPVIPTG
jgi:hypothetical protein